MDLKFNSERTEVFLGSEKADLVFRGAYILGRASLSLKEQVYSLRVLLDPYSWISRWQQQWPGLLASCSLS